MCIMLYCSMCVCGEGGGSLFYTVVQVYSSVVVYSLFIVAPIVSGGFVFCPSVL